MLVTALLKNPCAECGELLSWKSENGCILSCEHFFCKRCLGDTINDSSFRCPQCNKGGISIRYSFAQIDIVDAHCNTMDQCFRYWLLHGIRGMGGRFSLIHNRLLTEEKKYMQELIMNKKNTTKEKAKREKMRANKLAVKSGNTTCRCGKICNSLKQLEKHIVSKKCKLNKR